MATEKENSQPQKNHRVRNMTFVYTLENDAEVHVSNHRSQLITVGKAWEEFVAKHKHAGATKLVAFPGFMEPLGEKLREPSKKELKELAEKAGLL